MPMRAQQQGNRRILQGYTEYIPAAIPQIDPRVARRGGFRMEIMLTDMPRAVNLFFLHSSGKHFNPWRETQTETDGAAGRQSGLHFTVNQDRLVL